MRLKHEKAQELLSVFERNYVENVRVTTKKNSNGGQIMMTHICDFVNLNISETINGLAD